MLTRPAAAKRLALIGRAAREVLADYVEAIEIVEPTSVPRVVPNDIDDDQIIACALAAGAQLIVSGDRDLLTLHPWREIAILNAADAAQLIVNAKMEH